MREKRERKAAKKQAAILARNEPPVEFAEDGDDVEGVEGAEDVEGSGVSDDAHDGDESPVAE